jgi:hypothetical protein
MFACSLKILTIPLLCIFLLELLKVKFRRFFKLQLQLEKGCKNIKQSKLLTLKRYCHMGHLGFLCIYGTMAQPKVCNDCLDTWNKLHERQDKLKVHRSRLLSLFIFMYLMNRKIIAGTFLVVVIQLYMNDQVSVSCWDEPLVSVCEIFNIQNVHI